MFKTVTIKFNAIHFHSREVAHLLLQKVLLGACALLCQQLQRLHKGKHIRAHPTFQSTETCPACPSATRGQVRDLGEVMCDKSCEDK